MWTIAAISNPRIFARRQKVFANEAREYVRQRPDWRGLKFSCAWVFADKAHRHGVSAEVQLESARWLAHFRITLDDDGTWTRELICDRAKEAWER